MFPSFPAGPPPHHTYSSTHTEEPSGQLKAWLRWQCRKERRSAWRGAGLGQSLQGEELDAVWPYRELSCQVPLVN